MKSFITLLATFFLSIVLFANNNPSRLVVTNMENTTLRITVDGRKYDGIDKMLSLSDLSAGHHHIKVYKIRKGWFANDKLMYSSAVFFNPGYQVNIIINRSGDVSLATRQYRGNGRKSDRDYGRNNGYDKKRSRDSKSGYPSRRY